MFLIKTITRVLTLEPAIQIFCLFLQLNYSDIGFDHFNTLTTPKIFLSAVSNILYVIASSRVYDLLFLAFDSLFPVDKNSSHYISPSMHPCVCVT